MKFDLFFRFRLGLMADDRVIALIEALGMEGLGVYLALLCELRLHPDYRCSFASLLALARRWKVTPETLISVVSNFSLFHIYEQGDESRLFSSEYLDEEMERPSASRVSTVPLRDEPSVTVTGHRKRSLPPTVKRAANGRFTAAPDTIKNKKRKEEEERAEDLERERVEEPAAPTPVLLPAPVLLPSWEKRVDEAFAEQLWVEVQAMHSGLGRQFLEQLPRIVAYFKRHVVTYGKEPTILSVADAKNYFSNFIRRGTPMQRELQALLNKQASHCHAADPYRYEQRHPETGKRTYCGQPIPADAPPRPHENAVWSQALKQWA